MKVGVTEAKKRLPELIKAVEGGESVTICRHGKPVAEIVPAASTQPRKRQFDTLKGKVVIHDPDWWKPMTDEEADAFIEGRY